MTWKSSRGDSTSSSDPDSGDVLSLQKKLFAGKEGAQGELELSKELFDHHEYHHALALATQGLGKNPGMSGQFQTVLGCSALELGYVQEASYHLHEAKDAADMEPLKQRCLQQISQQTRAEL